MKAFNLVAAAAMAFALSIGTAAAAIIYVPVSGDFDFTGDLSMVTAATADDLPVSIPTTPFIAPPPDGIPAGEDVHIIARAFARGAGNTVDGEFTDRFLFDFLIPDPPGSANVRNTINIDLSSGQTENLNMENVELKLFSLADPDDIGAGMTLLGSVGGLSATGDDVGEFSVLGVLPGVAYMLQVTGNLPDGFDLGSYRLEFSATTIPVPPAIILLLTAFGALFGFAGLRKRASAEA
jgi:hypothetical protein